MSERKALFPFGLYQIDSWNFDPFKKDLLKLCTKNQDRHFDSFFRAYSYLKELIFRKSESKDQRFWFVFAFETGDTIYFDSREYFNPSVLPVDLNMDNLLCSSGTAIIGKFLDGVFEWKIVKNVYVKEMYYDTTENNFFRLQ